MRGAAIAVAAGLLCALSACSGASSPERAETTMTSTPTATPSAPEQARTLTYVALGDSLTAGYQRASGDDKGGAYPGLLTALLATDGIPMTVQNLSCTGETTTELVEGGRCDPSPSQLARAEAILIRDTGKVGLVTLFIGANDVLGCVSTSGVDEPCLARAHGAYSANLALILRRLRVAAGPDVPIVVLTYYNPFRVTVAGRPVPPGLASASAKGTEQLNATIRSAAQGVGATVLDTRPILEGSDGSALCTSTSVCSTGDFHLNAASNAALAGALRDVAAPLLPVAR